MPPRKNPARRMKRHRSPDDAGEGSSHGAKQSKASPGPESTQLGAETDQSLNRHQDIDITVSRRLDEDANSEDELDDSDDELHWYEELDGLATLKPPPDMPTVPGRGQRQIGSCNAQLIRRGRMRASFWVQMEETSQEKSDLAFELFDRYGRLNPEFYEHDVNKGTGVWGKELDRGDLLLFERLQIDAAYRRRGLGRELVNATLEKTRKMVWGHAGFFALARPGVLHTETEHLKEDSDEWREAGKDAKKGSTAFWHAQGFRRVGTTGWLAWTDSPGHPSRQLAIAEDWNPPDDQTAGSPLTGEMGQIFRRLADPAVEAAECVDELRKALPEDADDAQWQTTDQDGNTLLHVASMSCKPDAVSFLLSRVPQMEVLRNKKGHTALEALQDRLEHQRTRRTVYGATLVTSDEFLGFSDLDIACLAAFGRTPVFDLSILSRRNLEAIVGLPDERIRGMPELQAEVFQGFRGFRGFRSTLRYKYGCTCGQCIGGFLSPRMKFALLCSAQLGHDNLDSFQMHDTGPNWVAWNDHSLRHLPGPVRENMKTNKSMRRGFTNMFSLFANCLWQGRLPTEAEVLRPCTNDVSERPPVTRDYLQRGGTVSAVAIAIFEGAMEQDEWAGDGYHRKDFSEEIDALVPCRNDHEFGFVAGVCGHK